MALSTLLQDLRSTSRPAEKIAILRRHDSPFLRELLKATFNPFRVYYVNLGPDFGNGVPPGSKSLEDVHEHVSLLIQSCEGNPSPISNKERVFDLWCHLDDGSRDLLRGILEKSWRCGLAAKGVNKAFPRLIPMFEVQLANKFNPTKHHGKYQWSYKFDGIRVIALRDGPGQWSFYSRKGKKLSTLDHWTPSLESFGAVTGATFLDGEAYHHGWGFSLIQGATVRDVPDAMSRQLHFQVFAAGSKEAFLEQNEAGIWVPSIQELPVEAYSSLLVPVSMGTLDVSSESHVADALAMASERKLEGIMLRSMEQAYDFKRSDLLLKVKPQDSQDCKITDVDIGPFPVISDGMMVTEELLLAFQVEQEDGLSCKVGSGFTLPMRYDVAMDPLSFIGRTIEVQHQGIGSNGRMRFPVFKTFKDQ